MIDLIEINASLAQAVFDRVEGQLPGREGDWSLAVLDMSKPLVFNGSDDLSIPDEAGGRIVVDGVDPECVHVVPSRSIASPTRSLGR